MTIQAIEYPYEPTPSDIANFEAIWLHLWHPRFHNVAMQEYMQIKNLLLEAFLVGFNQYRTDVYLDLERSLHSD